MEIIKKRFKVRKAGWVSYQLEVKIVGDLVLVKWPDNQIESMTKADFENNYKERQV